MAVNSVDDHLDGDGNKDDGHEPRDNGESALADQAGDGRGEEQADPDDGGYAENAGGHCDDLRNAFDVMREHDNGRNGAGPEILQ